MQKNPDISIVVPVYNEEESLQAFYIELKKELDTLNKSHEIVFIDDGSTDTSLTLLKMLEEKDPHVRVYSFRRNSGKAEALTVGFQKALGNVVITMDADLQDQPSDIPLFLAKHEENIDVVCGWRKNRRDKSKMKFISRLFNSVVHRAFDIPVHDYNCGFKLYSKEAAQNLQLYGGQHRFIPAIVADQGFTVDEIIVHHAPRAFGYSKYGFSKIFKDLPDMFSMLFLIKYRKRPLHFFGIVGGLSMLIGSIILIYLVLIKLFTGAAIGGRPLLLFGALFFLAGLQIFFTGFIAELIVSMHQRTNPFGLKYSSEDEPV